MQLREARALCLLENLSDQKLPLVERGLRIMSDDTKSTIKILVPGRVVDPQILHFKCTVCECEFEVSEIECSVDIPTIYSDGVPVFMDFNGAQASHPCPTEYCPGLCWTTFERKFKGE